MAVTNFRFVHAADLHLDSPFVGLLEVDKDIASDLREATYRSFDRIVDLCLERGADFLLIAGDVYDSRDRSLPAQLRFRDGLRRLSGTGIPSFVVHGNHDPLDGWAATLEWSDLVYIFGGEKVTAFQWFLTAIPSGHSVQAFAGITALVIGTLGTAWYARRRWLS